MLICKSLMTMPLYYIFPPLNFCVTSRDLLGSYPALIAVTGSYGLSLVNPTTVILCLPPEPCPMSLSLTLSPLSRTDIGFSTCESVTMTRRYVSDTYYLLCNLLNVEYSYNTYCIVLTPMYIYQPYIEPPDVPE